MSMIRSVEEWTARYPGGASSPGFPRIAEAMLREGRTEEGIALALEGLQLQPSLVSGHLVLARLYQAAERLDEAKTEFEVVLRTDPRCPAARFHLAQIAERLQWKSVALEHWRQLCDIEPWDETAREAYGRMLREAPGGRAEPKLTEPYNPSTYPPDSEPTSAQAGSTFMPSEETTSDDLADALPTGSDWAFPAASDGATLEMPAAKDSTSYQPSSFQPTAFQPAPAAPEPAPEDILSAEPTSTGDDSQELGQAAPFSGNDVASRLNDLFGLPNDPESSTNDLEDGLMVGSPSPETWENPGTSELSGTSESFETKASTDDLAITQFQPVDADDAFGTQVSAEEVLLAEEQPELTETTDFERAGETGFLDQSPVDGDDIADRLDQIFASSETQMQEAVQASPMAPQPEAGGSNWTPVRPEADLSFTPTQEPEEEHPDSEARAAGESNILDRETVHGEDAGPFQSEVTGNDIADRLDAIFDESASASSMIFKDMNTLSMPAFGDVESKPEASVVEPFQPVSNPFADDSFAGRETMILSADALFNPESSSTFGTDNIETVDLKPSLEAIQFSTSDALTPESLGLPEVEGDDVGDRLDSLFGAEPETTSTATQFTSASVDFLQSEDSVPLEQAIAPSSDLEFETTLQEAAVVSGDDISSRLAEIFGKDDGDTEEKAIQLGDTPSQELEAAARGTHMEQPEAETMALEHGLSSGTEDFPAMSADSQGGAAMSDAGSLGTLQDGDFPPWLSEPEGNVPSSQPAALAKAPFEEEEAHEDEEAFEPGTTSIATVTLAEIYFSQGLKEQALQIYRQLLDREPENESAKKRIQEIEASKADGDDKGSGPDDSRPRPGLKIPRRKK